MIAGSLEITIAAEYAKFEDQLKDVASKAEDAGKKAAQNFGARFSETVKSFAKQAADGLSDELGNITKPKQLTAVVASALKEAAAGGDWKDTLLAGLRSVPIISSMADIVESVAKIATGAAEAEMKALRESAKADKAFAEAKARTDDINTRQQQHEDALLQQKIDNAVAVGDAYAEAYATADLEYQKIVRKRDSDLKKSQDDENGKQRQMIEQTYQDELAAITRSYDLKVQKADEAAAKEADDRRKKAEDEATREFKEREDAAKELAKVNERLAKEEKQRKEEIKRATDDAEKMRAEAASQTGSMSTSFGTFTFSAYTDSEKKANDEKIVSELKNVVTAIEQQPMTGGFA